jgi:hypothetical protein
VQKQNLNLLVWEWKAITLCVIIAAAFWLFNSLNKTYTTRISYPVTFKINPNQVMAISELPTALDLEVTGQGWSIFRKSFAYYREPIVIDLINPLRNTQFDTKKFLPYFTTHIKDLKINHIIPDTLQLHFDKIASKKIYLKANASLPLKGGFKIVSSVQIFPQAMLFKGASTALDGFPDTLFIKLEEEGIDQNYEQVSVSLVYPHADFVKPESDKVKVSFRVAPFSERNQLVAVRLLNFPIDSLAYIEEKSIILHYWFKQEYENRFSMDSIKAYIDFKKRNPKDSTIIPQFYLPKVVAYHSFTPQKIKLIYEKNTKNRNYGGDRRR